MLNEIKIKTQHIEFVGCSSSNLMRKFLALDTILEKKKCLKYNYFRSHHRRLENEEQIEDTSTRKKVMIKIKVKIQCNQNRKPIEKISETKDSLRRSIQLMNL